MELVLVEAAQDLKAQLIRLQGAVVQELSLFVTTFLWSQLVQIVELVPRVRHLSTLIPAGK
jgi:hypothetical protein